MTVRRKRAPVPKIQEVTDEIGRVYRTNNCGDVVVLEYVTSKRITVKFLETGNQYVTQKHQIEKGLIKDNIKWLKDIADRDKAIKDEKDRLKKESLDRRIAVFKAKKEESFKEKAKKFAEARRIRIEKDEHKSLEKTQAYKELIGQKYSHSYFGEYEVVDFDLSRSPQAVKVKFSITGYESWANKGVVLRGSVYDKSRDNEEGWKVLVALSRSKDYQENRDQRLQQAKQWQKDNPDKCRVRNQNRRAKRFELGGEVTLEELNALMEAQDYKCANCKDELTDENKHMDHIIPIALKGTGDIKNIQWLCDYCNLSKNDKHPDLWAKVVATKEWWDIKELRQKGLTIRLCKMAL